MEWGNQKPKKKQQKRKTNKKMLYMKHCKWMLFELLIIFMNWRECDYVFCVSLPSFYQLIELTNTPHIVNCNLDQISLNAFNGTGPIMYFELFTLLKPLYLLLLFFNSYFSPNIRTWFVDLSSISKHSKNIGNIDKTQTKIKRKNKKK